MTSDDRYVPDAGFVAALEWQLAGEGRRRARFTEAGRRGVPRARWPVAAALVLSGLVLGAGGVIAAEKAHLGARRQSLLARADVLVELAEKKRDFAAESLAETEQRVAAGMVSTMEAAADRARFEASESELARLRLDRAEIDASGMAPRDDLGAPAIGGRDFVGERLALGLAAAEKARDRAVEATRLAAQLVAAGAAPDDERRELAGVAAAAESTVKELRERAAVRSLFVAGTIDADCAEREGLLASARARLARATEFAQSAAARADLVRQRFEAGAESQRVLRDAEAEAFRLDAERRLQVIEVETLERRARRDR